MGNEQDLNEFQRLESLWNSIEKMDLKGKEEFGVKNEEKNTFETIPDDIRDTQKIVNYSNENTEDIKKDFDLVNTADLKKIFNETNLPQNLSSDENTEDLKKDFDSVDTIDLKNIFNETEQPQDLTADEIEELSMEELALLSSKIEQSSSNSLTYENPDGSQKMILVETSEGLNLGMALPIELTNYKPDFVVTNSGINHKIEPEKTEKKRTLAEKFYFYEDGTFLGITVGQSGKADVLRIMREFGSKVFKPKDTTGKNYFFDELSLTVLFDDIGTVKELTVGSSFQGQTSKGLRIGDHIEKVFEIYGKPQKITPIGFEWGNFLVFHKNNLVTHFRLRI